MSRDDLRAVRGELAVLRQEVRLLRLAMGGDPSEIAEVLRRRGIVVSRANPAEDLLMPARISSGMLDRFYELLKRYSFRLFVRDVITHRDDLTVKALTRFCSRQTAAEYLEILRETRIVRRDGGREKYRLSKDLQSFGPTLEWFVAQVFQREFQSPALWGVRLLDLVPGGDYDVLTLVEGSLLYVEVKSSPPKHIEQREIAAFFDRVGELIPNAALFLVDTELRMKDKIVPMFEEECHRRERPAEARRLVDELFRCDDRIFLVNSRPGLVGGLARCLRYWLGTR
jgi:hypothetical protein